MVAKHPHWPSQQSQGRRSGKAASRSCGRVLNFIILYLAQSHTASGLLQVNMDPTLWDVLHEATHLTRPPLCVSLPPYVRLILTHADPHVMRERVTLLQSVVQAYNQLREGLLDVDEQLFQSKLQSVDNVSLSFLKTVKHFYSTLLPFSPLYPFAFHFFTRHPLLSPPFSPPSLLPFPLPSPPPSFLSTLLQPSLFPLSSPLSTLTSTSLPSPPLPFFSISFLSFLPHTI